jgi:hypothetical protein
MTGARSRSIGRIPSTPLTVDTDTGVIVEPPPDDPPPDEPPPDDPPPDDPPPPEPTVECYAEPIFPDADINSMVLDYGGVGWKSELITIMEHRHPATASLLDAQQDDSYFAQFSNSSSWTGMVGWLDTLTHEETHLYNAELSWDLGADHVLFLTDDHVLELPEVPDFPRSEIYSEVDPFAIDGIYAGLYLTGWQGERGLLPLLDETSCYLAEIGSVGSVGEHFQQWVSVKDGVTAFLYFIEVYLRQARLEHPALYEGMKAEVQLQKAVELLWVRAHFLLPFADVYENLGIDDEGYRALMHDPENMNEISLFIDAQVEDGPCVTREPVTY